MTYSAGSAPPVVNTASPVGRPFGYIVLWIFLHSARICGPPARWIAPSTPPPPIRDEFAAFTIAVTACFVISATTTTTRPSKKYSWRSCIAIPSRAARFESLRTCLAVAALQQRLSLYVLLRDDPD